MSTLSVVGAMSTLSAGAALLTVGCGGSDKTASTQSQTSTQPPSLQLSQRGVLATIDELQIAARAGDAGKICKELFTANLRRSIGAASKRTCASAVRKQFDRNTSISVGRDFQVDGAKAKAVIRDQTGRTATLYLLKQGDAYRIDRLAPGQS
ncbi:MAG TPA: hypothetical protein VF526_13275 [Solirubrobacteraceae bacterium]